MIVQWFLSAVGSVITWFLDLLPDFLLPDNWDNIVVQWAGVVNTASKLGHWFPLQAFALALIVVLAALGTAFAIRLTRIVLSFITAGGGSAA